MSLTTIPTDFGTGGSNLNPTGNSPTLKDVLIEHKNALETTILRSGGTLANSDSTKNPASDAASLYTLASGTLTSNHTLTLGTAGSPVTNTVVQILRRDVTSFTYAIINGGTGAGTMFTFAGTPSSAQGASFYFDGTNWNFLNFFYLV